MKTSVENLGAVGDGNTGTEQDIAAEPVSDAAPSENGTAGGDRADRGIAARSVSNRRGRRETSRPARTRPGTAPSAAVTMGRRGRRVSAKGENPPLATRTKSQFVWQVVALALVFFAVAFAVAVPLRNYLAQRSELTATVAQEQQLRDQLAALTAQQHALSDPAYIMSQAKRRLQYVKPGDTVYVVHAPPLAVPKPAGAKTSGSTPPWYSELWRTLAAPVGSGKPEQSSASAGVAPTTSASRAGG